MRSNGDPNQADPTIDANGVINITIPAEWPGGGRLRMPKGTGQCSQYLIEARILRAGEPVPPLIPTRQCS